MVGYVSMAIAQALRGWPTLKKANVIPVMATDNGGVIVNTPIPAIALYVKGEDGEGNTYLGSGIRFYFELQLHVIVPLTNYTFSEDGGRQGDMLNLAEDVVRCIEQSNTLDAVKREHDMNLQFDRLETYSSYARANAISEAVDVHEVVYKGSVEFIPYPKGDTRFAKLRRVEIDNGATKSIVE